MRHFLLSCTAAFALASVAALAALGCGSNVSVKGSDPDPDTCEEPKPDIPSDSWCPPIYECVEGEWVDTAGTCEEPECPGEKPADGSVCLLPGQVCSYDEWSDCGAEQVQAHCTANGWFVGYSYCSPAPECPGDLPVAGTDCAGWDDAFACEYYLKTACGYESAWLACHSEPGSGAAVWTLTTPLFCSVCEGYDNEATCAASLECMWLTPGCGDEPIQTGCYPKTGCDVAGCDDGSVCVETTYDPCEGKPCEACGASYFACLPGDAL